MAHYPHFRFSKDDIDASIPESTWDESYLRWFDRGDELDALIRQVTDAFVGFELDDGIGLLEANGRDDYESAKELTRLRSLDIRTDWRTIDTKNLYCYDSAPTFMDARGFVFHIPVFLIAELNDEFDGDFLTRLYQEPPRPTGWIEMLDDAQALAIADVLDLVRQHPEYTDEAVEISGAIKRLREGRG